MLCSTISKWVPKDIWHLCKEGNPMKKVKLVSKELLPFERTAWFFQQIKEIVLETSNSRLFAKKVSKSSGVFVFCLRNIILI